MGVGRSTERVSRAAPGSEGGLVESRYFVWSGRRSCGARRPPSIRAVRWDTDLCDVCTLPPARLVA